MRGGACRRAGGGGVCARRPEQLSAAKVSRRAHDGREPMSRARCRPLLGGAAGGGGRGQKAARARPSQAGADLAAGAADAEATAAAQAAHAALRLLRLLLLLLARRLPLRARGCCAWRRGVVG